MYLYVVSYLFCPSLADLGHILINYNSETDVSKIGLSYFSYLLLLNSEEKKTEQNQMRLTLFSCLLICIESSLFHVCPSSKLTLNGLLYFITSHMIPLYYFIFIHTILQISYSPSPSFSFFSI